MVSEKLQSINWDEVELESVNRSMKRRIVTGRNMTVARIYFKDGFTVPMHSHHNEQITQVIKGEMRFVFVFTMCNGRRRAQQRNIFVLFFALYV